jgi:hypothetical protein
VQSRAHAAWRSQHTTILTCAAYPPYLHSLSNVDALSLLTWFAVAEKLTCQLLHASTLQVGVQPGVRCVWAYVYIHSTG